MKKNLLFFLLFLQATLSAQTMSKSSSAPIPDSSYLYGWGQPTPTDMSFFQKHLYTYDVYGRMTQDSIFTVPTGFPPLAYIEEYNYSYDANGNLLTRLRMGGHVGNGFQVDELDSNTYDAHNNKIIYEAWREVSGNLQKGLTRRFIYDANDNLLMQADSGAVVMGVWDLQFKISYAYNSNNDSTLVLYQQNNNGTMDSMDLYLFHYDQQNRMDSATEIFFSSTGVRTTSIMLYRYNAAGLRDTAILKAWFGGSWFEAKKTTITYNANGNVLTSIEKSYLGDTTSYEIYTYDADNYITSFESNPGLGTRYEYTYDIHHNLLRRLQFQQPAWTDWADLLYTYTPENNVLTYLRRNYNSNTLQWANVDSTHYYYSNVTGIEETGKKNMLLYPNPARESVMLVTGEESKQQQLEIYNTAGRLVAARILNSNIEHLSLKGFAKGIYILKVKSNTGQRVQQLVIE